MRRRSVEERFWSKVDKSSDCWVWTAYRTHKGYGLFSIEHGKLVQVHRWSYEQHHGTIPDGLEIDHICRVRACVNPSHLRAVTHKQNIENADRRIGISGVRWVIWDKHKGRWRVIVKHDGKNHSAGTFADLADAEAAAIAKHNELQGLPDA